MSALPVSDSSSMNWESIDEASVDFYASMEEDPTFESYRRLVEKHDAAIREAHRRLNNPDKYLHLPEFKERYNHGVYNVPGVECKPMVGAGLSANHEMPDEVGAVCVRLHSDGVDQVLEFPIEKDPTRTQIVALRDTALDSLCVGQGSTAGQLIDQSIMLICHTDKGAWGNVDVGYDSSSDRLILTYAEASFLPPRSTRFSGSTGLSPTLGEGWL